MPRGQPDFGAYAAKKVTASLADMAELAVRLGSMDNYDRRGDVVLIDDFEDALIKWGIVKAVNDSIILDSTSVKSGSQAVKITTEAAAPRTPAIIKYIQTLGSRSVGAEISFSAPQTTYSFFMWIMHYDGTNVLFGYVILDFNAKTISIEGRDAGIKVIASDIDFRSENHHYFPVKLVVDFATEKYVRLLVGNVQYELSTYTLLTTGSGVEECDVVQLNIANDATATAASIWLDDFILTQNEP